MPIIYTYPAKVTPVGNDLIIISDSEANKITKRAKLSTAVTNNQIKYDLNATQDGLNVDLNLTSSDASDDSVVQFTAGTNVSLTRNSATEITISASGGGNLPIEDEGIQITGAAAKINFTGAGVTATAAGNDVTVDIPGGGGGYVLPLAANGTRGGIQIGYVQNAKNYPVVLSAEKAYVNVPWTDTDTNTTYTLQAEAKSGSSVPLKLDASSGTDSTVNLTEGANVTLTRNSANEITIAAAGGGGGGVTSFTNANGTYISAGTVNTNATGAVTVGTIDLSAVDGTAVAGTRFLSKDNTWDVPAYTTYNAASSSNLGLMKLASDTEQSVAANAVTSESGRTYGIQFNADDQAVVNVPWTDTDTNTNIYTTDGTINANRVVTLANTYSLKVKDSSNVDLLSIAEDGTFALGLGASSSANSAVAIGKSASVGSLGISIGESAIGSGGGSLTIGTYATTGNSVAAVALGYDVDIANGSNSSIAIGSYINSSGARSITFNATAINGVTTTANDVFSVYMTSNTTPDFKVVGNGTSDLQTKLDLSEQLLIRGDGSANAGNLKLNCYANSHHVNLIGPDHTSAVSYNIKFPNAGPGGNNKILESDSSGNLSWIDTPSGGGSSSKLGFTPLSIYGATHEISSGQGGKTIYRQSVVETDCVIDKVDFFVTAVTGTCNLTVAIYLGNLTTATRVLIGTSGALTTGINTITFTSSYTFSAGDDIVIYTSQSAGEEISNSIAGDSGLLNNSLLSRRSASYDATPPTSISPPETSGAEGLALHFYDE